MNITVKKDKNVMIIKRRRKILLKRCLLLTTTLVSILLILCYKLPVFDITDISVENNKVVSSNVIIKLSKIQKGSNIFYINFYRSKNSILNNPYIKTVSIHRQLPSKCIIVVNERAAKYYNSDGNNFYVIDKDGVVLEKRDNISDMKLSKLSGFDFSKAVAGRQLTSDDKRKFNVVSDISNLMSLVDINMTSVDVADLNNIQVNFENINVKLGSKENLKKKLNIAINIINSNKDYKTAKGYIDVSYNGAPVICIEK